MSVPSFTALVPMKAQSQRVPGKNVRPLCGRPLFHWILGALRQSRYVSSIVVNADSPAIGEEAARLFGVVYLPRPKHLLGDFIYANELIAHDLSCVPGAYFVQTHATNPLLTFGTIDAAIERFLASPTHDSLFTVNEFHTRFYWPDGGAINHDPTSMVRSQDLPPVYEENSCLYVFTRASFSKHGRRIGERPLMMPMDPLESIDIDEEFQFTIAETLMGLRLRQGGAPR